MKRQNKQKGITLVALVLTIIVLLILAGISIQALTNTGIFGKAQEAKQKSEDAAKQEQSLLTEYEDELNRYTSKDKWDGKVNKPELMTGMTAIQFNDPTEDEEGSVKVVSDSSKNDWYNYDAKKWANAKTQDGSMWVWIPRYAYQITYYTDENKTTKSSSKTQYGSIDVKFLVGTTDNYYDENGKLQTAKRQKKAGETIDTTTGYTVHPAFTNETKINYANGGWKKELAGIWVSKFEAGYATGNNTVTKADGTAYTKETVPASSVKYAKDDVYSPSGWVAPRNWIDGEYGSTETYIKYPTFQGLTYSMNYINHNDAYNISKVLTENNNIYGLNSSNTDSHLMKDSEWGAVAYLSQSKYGLNGANIYINNANLNSSTGATNVYAVTGCSAKTTADDDQVVTTIEAINKREANVYTWTQKNGQKASTTGTIYGIYDMSGGTWERTAGLVANSNGNLAKYGSSLINAVTKTSGASTTYESTPYVTVYPSNDSGITNIDTASRNNYAENTKIYGDAIRETSTAGVGQSSWYSDYSDFAGYNGPFFIRGGDFWGRTGAGLFCFARNDGPSHCGVGFRAVLVAE